MLARIPRAGTKLFTAIILCLVACLAFPADASAATKKKKKSSKSSSRKKSTGTSYVAKRYYPPVRGFTTVIIDAGHGGHDNGGIFGQKIPEKVYTLDVAKRLRSILASKGFRTVMTRSDDTFVSLPDRVRIADSYSNAIFVSVHFNSSVIPTGHGFETYYYTPNTQSLAARIQSRLMRVLPTTQNRGVKSRGYFVLRRPRTPAVLAECGFLTNYEESRYILNASFRQKLAQAIAAAIIEQRGS